VYGGMNPADVIAERTPAQKGKENNIRCAALRVQHGSPHRGFVCGFQDQ
jgi:hypothetical protein